MSHLLSLDPGIRSPGVALWETCSPHSPLESPSRLLAAGKVAVRVKPDGDVPLWTSDAERWIYVAGEIVGWMLRQAQALQIERQLRVATFVFEKPVLRREVKSRGDHNNLVPLAAVGTAVAVILATSGVCPRVLSPKPEDWTGQLPKTTTGDAWKSPRGRRIAGRLRPEELALVPDQHDCIDAVGLGLWALGRLDVRRAFQAP